MCFPESPEMRVIAYLAVFPLIFPLLHGCAGALGGTKPFVLDLDPPPGVELRHPVAVGSIAVAEHDQEVDSVGTYHVGKFSSSELADLRQSLVDTLDRIAWPAATHGVRPLGIHLLVSHYYVAHSNNDGGVVAGIDWALVSSPDEIILSERFFASIQASDLEGLNTLGKVKNALNAQVIRRVVEKSLQLSADRTRTPDARTAHTYDTIEEAVVGMPERLTSVFGLPSLSTKKVDWTTGAPAEPIDWAEILTDAQE